MRCIVLQRDTIRVRVGMLASRMGTRESRHRSKAWRLRPGHACSTCPSPRKQGMHTGPPGGGNASETCADIIQISACNLLALTDIKCAKCARHATPLLSATASKVFDNSNCKKTLYGCLNALAALPENQQFQGTVQHLGSCLGLISHQTSAAIHFVVCSVGRQHCSARVLPPVFASG